jgi:indolepyruvate ferredoxin oxidoreductase
VSLDARGLAEEFFDDDQFANVLQLGAAYQTGAIPLPASVIERAIELNGTQVAANLQAFRRGRLLVAEPPAKAPEPVIAAKPSAVRALVHAEPGSELARLLDIRIPELIAYQDKAYARAYAEFVERVRVLEDGPTEITEAVAKHLYKLMAYKDEYEVARLSLDPAFTDGLEDRSGCTRRCCGRSACGARSAWARGSARRSGCSTRCGGCAAPGSTRSAAPRCARSSAS